MSRINPSQDLYFPSKRDRWLVGLIWGSVLASVVGGVIPLALPGTPWIEVCLVGGLLVSIDALMLWVLYGTGYHVKQDVLLIRCGPFSFRVPLADIESIVPGNSILSSPACSIDRLKIVYGLSQQSIMISPADKPGFLSAIVQQCPSLMMHHGRVQKNTGSSSTAIEPTVQPQILA